MVDGRGQGLFVGARGEKDPEQIVAAIDREHVTVMHFVPSMLWAFLEYLEEKRGCRAFAFIKTSNRQWGGASSILG